MLGSNKSQCACNQNFTAADKVGFQSLQKQLIYFHSLSISQTVILKKNNNNNNYSGSKEVSSHCITLHLTSKQP